jgi:hypothetical protein
MNKALVVKFIFEYLNENFDYLILRNYENLPEDEGHDIDILISQNEELKIYTLLKLIEEKFNINVYENNRYKNLRSSLLVMDDYILHLDFFLNIQWLNVPLFDTKELLEKKEKFKSFYILDNLSLEKYCWYLYIIRNEKVKEKYKKLAFSYEKNKSKDIDISLQDKKRKQKLVIELLNKSYFNFIMGVYTSISIKVKKLLNPYARIINIKKNSCKNLEIIKGYIFIGSKEYSADVKLSDVVNIYLLLTNEHLVILNNQTNKSWLYFLKRYTITCDDSLKITVEKILGKYKLK